MSGTPPQQYCLRWNNYQNNLTNVFDQLLQSEAFVDVTLSCEGHSLKAHKVVLSACSPYFQSLFFDNPCKHPIVILNGIKWEELKSIVEFMYRGEINVSQEQLAPLLKVAEVLKIRGLADVSRGSALANPTLQSSLDAEKRPNPADFLSNSTHDSESESSISGGRRKRRKVSTPDRTPSPPDDDVAHDMDSTNGDFDHEGSTTAGIMTSTSPAASTTGGASISATSPPSMSLNPISSSSGSLDIGRALSSASGTNLGSIGPAALLNLHAAAAAAAAVASAANNQGQGSSSTSNAGASGSSEQLDIKPGIVEMIREEERAKMLESAHGWLGPSASAAAAAAAAGTSLSDSYQYQIQNLWQKCWNQNQGGMMHALRFRERGPLKSWRPETMAEAIFAVLREGLSLSQAARKYDIPYPTFVLYANRVHNMLGPSTDGSSSSDLMSDMRPKGRGRPQRILLGTWPEDHIRGVIRAVVFRDTQTKDDVPFLFNRDGGLCVSQSGANSTTTTNSNGMDINPLQSHFSSPFGSTPASSTPSTPTPSTSSAHVNLININDNPAQHLQVQMGQSNSRSSSTSSSPLQQALASNQTPNSLSGIGAQAQSQLLAFQQRHLLQQRRSSTDLNPLSNLLKKGSQGGLNLNLPQAAAALGLGNLASFLNCKPEKEGSPGEKEIMQIKTELTSYDDEEDVDELPPPDQEEISNAKDLSRTSPLNEQQQNNNNLERQADQSDDASGCNLLSNAAGSQLDSTSSEATTTS